MKTRNIISLFVVTLPLAAGSVACGSNPQGTNEPVAQTEQEQVITGMGSIMAWPIGPVTWNGLMGTWPIALWSPATIGAVAFGVSGVSSLGFAVAGFPGIAPVPITTPLLNAFIPPVAAAPLAGAPFLGPAGLVAPAFGFTGSFAPWTFPGAGWGFGFNAFAPTGAFATTFANGAFTAGLNWWSPTLTSSAIMATSLAPLSTFMPFTFNLTFQAASAATAATISAQAATMASLSIFATPILPTAFAAQTAAIPFMSIAFPILPMPIAPLGLGAVTPLGLGAAAPLGLGAAAPLGAVAPVGAVAPIGAVAPVGAVAPLL